MALQQNEGRPVIGVLELGKGCFLAGGIPVDENLPAPCSLVRYRLTRIIAANGAGDELPHADGKSLAPRHVWLQALFVEALHQERGRLVGDGPERCQDRAAGIGLDNRGEALELAAVAERHGYGGLAGG